MTTALIVVVGQSNERGTGGSGTASESGYGPWHRDPIPPRGNQYSMWPRLVDSLARRAGVRAIVRNTAEGSTTIAKGWVGMVRTWSASRVTAAGEWVLPTVGNGYKYKSTGTRDVSCGASQPAWPTSVGATVVDGSVTWTCAAADANDIDGHIYTPGESGFDPMGLFAGIAAQDVGAFDRKIAVCSIGQSDHATNTTGAQFEAAWAIACDWLAARGITPYLGMTSANATYLAKMTGEYTTAVNAVVQSGKARPGANLATLFGVQSTHDGVHMTPSELDRASDAWADALIAG